MNNHNLIENVKKYLNNLKLDITPWHTCIQSRLFPRVVGREKLFPVYCSPDTPLLRYPQS